MSINVINSLTHDIRKARGDLNIGLRAVSVRRERHMMNKLLLASALALTVVLTGCGSTKTGSIDNGVGNGGGNGNGDDNGNGGDGGNGDSTTFDPSTGGWWATTTVAPPADPTITGPETAPGTGYVANQDRTSFLVNFGEGPLEGQNFTFTGNGEQGADGSYFAETADGDLTVFIGDASVAGLVIVNHPEPAIGIDAYAFHGANPAYTGEHSRPESGVVTYSGNFAGTGIHGNPAVDGQAAGVRGNVSLKADFGSNQITDGLISGLVLDDDPLAGDEGEAFESGNISFSGTITGGSYTGTATAAGWAGATGDVVGGFYGEDAAETAGSVAIRGDGANSLIGAYQAGRD